MTAEEPNMPILDLDNLRQRIESLKGKGVRIPSNYPPANLEAHTVWFRGFLAELEVVELLVENISPELIEMKLPGEQGDVDIFIHAEPPQNLQVKSLFPEMVSTGKGTFSLESIKNKTKELIRDEIKNKNLEQSTLSEVEVRLGDDGNPLLYGTTKPIDSNVKANVTILGIDTKVMDAIVRNKIEKSIQKSLRQLQYANGVRLPVIDLTLYPHNQKESYIFVKDLLQKNPQWRTIGGVLLVTSGYENVKADSGFIPKKRRIIGIPNPNSPENERLNPGMYNPDYLDEDVYEEEYVSIVVEPSGTAYSIRGGKLFIDGKYFTTLPDGLSVPFLFGAKEV